MVEIIKPSPEASAKLLLTQYKNDFVEYQLAAAVKGELLPIEMKKEVADLHTSLKEEYEKENPDTSVLANLAEKLKAKLNECFSEIKAAEKRQIAERPFLEGMWKKQNKLDKALIDQEDRNFGVQKLATLALEQKIIDKELHDNYTRCARNMRVSLDNPDVPFAIQKLWLSGVKGFQEDILFKCKDNAARNPVSADVRERAERSATYKLSNYKRLRRSEHFKRISESLQKHAESCCSNLEVAVGNGKEPIIFIESLRDQLGSVIDVVKNIIDAHQNKEDEATELKRLGDQIDTMPE